MTESRELQTKTEQLEKVNMQNADSTLEVANSRRMTVAEKLLRIANLPQMEGWCFWENYVWKEVQNENEAEKRAKKQYKWNENADC